MRGTSEGKVDESVMDKGQSCGNGKESGWKVELEGFLILQVSFRLLALGENEDKDCGLEKKKRVRQVTVI